MKRIPLFFSILVLFFACACGEYYETSAMQSVSNQNGENLTLVVSPDNINIASGGNATVQIIIRTGEGDAIEGAAVYLTATLGTLGDNVLDTGTDGTAVTMLSPGDVEGWSVVVATYGTIQAIVKVSMYYDGSNDSSGSGGGGGFDDGSDGTGGETGQ